MSSRQATAGTTSDVHQRGLHHRREQHQHQRRRDVRVERRVPGKRQPVLGALKSQFVPKANAIDPNLKDPKNDEIMFAFQRELAPNWSLNVDWIQRWFRDMTTDQDCYGLPCNTVASTVYAPNKTVTDFGPDNLAGTADDRQLTFSNVLPQYVGKDTFFHTNCGNNTTIDCVDRYKAIEISISKRMSNRWQMQASYVWSRLDGVQQGINTNSTTTRIAYDFTNPNNLMDLGLARGRVAAPTISRTPSSCSAAIRPRTASRSARTTRRSVASRTTAP